MAFLLKDYDGSAGVMVDSNVWIDCMDASSAWHDWAIDHLQLASEAGALHINQIIYAELLVPAMSSKYVDEVLGIYQTLHSNLPWEGAALTAGAYQNYRQRGGSKALPMPDFYIGAHAAVMNLSVLSRDKKLYSTYFPRLNLFG